MKDINFTRKTEPIPLLVLTAVELSHALKISTKTIEELVAAGELRPITLGRRGDVFPMVEVERFIHSKIANKTDPRPQEMSQAARIQRELSRYELTVDDLVASIPGLDDEQIKAATEGTTELRQEDFARLIAFITWVGERQPVSA